jgi:hypothetical protein
MGASLPALARTTPSSLLSETLRGLQTTEEGRTSTPLLHCKMVKEVQIGGAFGPPMGDSIASFS